MTVYDMAKDYYKRGLWSRARVEALVEAGRLTEDEAREIMGVEG